LPGVFVPGVWLPNAREKKALREEGFFFSLDRVVRGAGMSVRQTEKDEPQPQVLVAFGFLMTNCAPSRPSE